MGATSIEVRVPDLGDVGDVVVVEWLKSAGDVVADGDDLVEVETEKTAFVIPAPVSGRVGTITAEAGDRLRVGELLGNIETE